MMKARWIVIIGLLLLAGCASKEGQQTDGGVQDLGDQVDPAGDAALDGASDVGADASADVPADGSVDLGEDSAPDGSTDGPSDTLEADSGLDTVAAPDEVCVPSCPEGACGDDGCGGDCGGCDAGTWCSEHQCVGCAPGAFSGTKTTGDDGLTWVSLPAGCFNLGCSEGDSLCQLNEYPVHAIVLGAFEMLETEVTEAQYLAIAGASPSCKVGGATGPDMPVECVSWFDANAFCEQVGGRLPTEDEWEYATRAGTTTAWYCGADKACLDGIAWYDQNSGETKHDVKGKLPNAWGLYDLSGNVLEWVVDWYQPNYYETSPGENPPGPEAGTRRVFRGGSFFSFDYYNRSSSRLYIEAERKYEDLGFRCVRAN
jgi:formylglycine-generating enzyme required for sulfatase activity